MFLILITSLLSACSVLQPFIDRRRNAGVSDVSHLYVGRSKPEKPAVCANLLWTSKEKIQALADEECRKHQTGTHAVEIEQTRFTCRLLLPTHIYFKCEK